MRIEDFSVQCKFLSLTKLRNRLIELSEFFVEPASMIMGVVFCENQHIAQVKLLVEVKLQRALEAVDVPFTNVDAILLQVGH